MTIASLKQIKAAGWLKETSRIGREGSTHGIEDDLNLKYLSLGGL